jgi:hypothetical protein
LKRKIRARSALTAERVPVSSRNYTPPEFVGEYVIDVAAGAAYVRVELQKFLCRFVEIGEQRRYSSRESP